MQQCAFEIKIMSPQIAKHLLDPHFAFLISQGHPAVWQVGCQTPRLLFAGLPVGQQMDRTNISLGQTPLSQLNALTALLNEAAEI